MSENEQLSPEEKLLKVIQDPTVEKQTAENRKNIGKEQSAKSIGQSAQSKAPAAVEAKSMGQSAKGHVNAKHNVGSAKETVGPVPSPGVPSAPVQKVQEDKMVKESGKQEDKKPKLKTPAAAEEKQKPESGKLKAPAAPVQAPAAAKGIGQSAQGKEGTLLPTDQTDDADKSDPVSRIPYPASVNTQQPGNPTTQQLNVDKGQASRKFGISIINRSLAAIIIIMLLFSGFEIWGNIRKLDSDTAVRLQYIDVSSGAGVDGNDGGNTAGNEGLVDIANVLPAFAKRPMMGFPLKKDDRPPVPGPGPEQQRSNWQLYVEQNYKLVALGVTEGGAQEAIVLDTNADTQRTLILEVGQSITVDGQNLQVKSIGANFVHLTDGTNIGVVNQ